MSCTLFLTTELYVNTLHSLAPTLFDFSAAIDFYSIIQWLIFFIVIFTSRHLLEFLSYAQVTYILSFCFSVSDLITQSVPCYATGNKKENRWWVFDGFRLTLAIIITWLDCHTLDNLYIHTIIARSPSILKFSNSQLCSLSHYLNGKYVYSQFHTIPSVDHVSHDLRPHCGLRMTSEFSDRLLTRDVFTTIWDINIVELKILTYISHNRRVAAAAALSRVHNYKYWTSSGASSSTMHCTRLELVLHPKKNCTAHSRAPLCVHRLMNINWNEKCKWTSQKRI